MFGTATSKDVQMLAKAVVQMTETSNRELKIFKKTTADMSSFAEKSNAQMEKLIANVQTVSIQNFKIYENLTQTFATRMLYANNITLHLSKWIFHTTLLLNHYESFLEAVTALSNGKLHPFLVDEDMLKNAISHVADELMTNYTEHRIIYTSPKFYYTYGKYVYGVVNNKLYITMRIPLTTIEQPFHLYKVERFPMIIDVNEHVTQIMGIPEAVAISRDRSRYLTFGNNEDFQRAQNNFHSEIQSSFRKKTEGVCIIDLFVDNRDAIDKNCKYTVSPNAKQSMIYHWNESSYLLINVKQYKLTCGTN
jgi:hypothetical protein